VANPLVHTDSSIDGVLKNVYEDFRINAFPKLTVLLAQLKKAKAGGPERMQWGGNGCFWDVVLGRPVGMTASQAGFFPPTSAVMEKQAFVGIKRTYVTREIDALAIQATAAREAAYVPLVRKIVQEAMDAAQLGQQEVLQGTGRGIKGLIGSVTDTTHIVVTDPYGLTGAGRGGLLLDKGMFVAVHDTSAADAILGTATIAVASNSGDNVTLTLGTAISGMAAGDKVVAAATATDTSLDAYPNGLANMTNRAAAFNSLHNLSPATAGVERWDSLRLVAGTDTDDASIPSEFDVWKLITRVANLSGKNAKTNPGEFLVLTTPGLERRFAEQFFGQRQWEMKDNVELKGGFSAVRLCGLPLVTDPWCPAGTLYLIHIPSLCWVDRQDWVKLSYEGSGPWRFIDGRDAYQVNFGAYWNTAVLQRNSHGSITGYTDTDRYDFVV